MLLDITATEAKARSAVPGLAIKLNKAIREAADRGLQGVDYEGILPHKMYDELVLNGFEMTKKGSTTWIWWGA